MDWSVKFRISTFSYNSVIIIESGRICAKYQSKRKRQTQLKQAAEFFH